MVSDPSVCVQLGWPFAVLACVYVSRERYLSVLNGSLSLILVHVFGPGNGSQAPPTLFLLVLVLSDLRSAKAFSFHNQLSSNFAYI